MKIHPSCKHLAAALLAALAVFTHSVRASVPAGPPVFTHPLDITNAYMPFQPGGMKVFTGVDGESKTAVVDTYLTETRSFSWNGQTVECRILRETSFAAGKLLEIADNYFAQSDDGTVYYFGEVVDNYDGPVVADHHGSWLVGGPVRPGDPAETAVAVNPAVFMPGKPELGDVFKPEDLFPLVDETARVVATAEKLRFNGLRFKDVLVLKETTQLSPAKEKKWYAPGVGVVMAASADELLQLAASTLVRTP